MVIAHGFVLFTPLRVVYVGKVLLAVYTRRAQVSKAMYCERLHGCLWWVYIHSCYDGIYRTPGDSVGSPNNVITGVVYSRGVASNVPR